jgi:nitric oxide reductase activation protein
MIRGLINEDPHIFKKNIINEGKNEIAIALLIDHSGSMQGEKILNAQKAAILFGEVLNALDLIFAIYGWTDIPFYDVYLMQTLRRTTNNLPLVNIEYYPGINPEIFTVFCYKEFNESYESSKQKLGMVRALCDNSDHNAVEFVTAKLLQTKKRIKILMVLSDGQPNAMSYQFIQQRLKNDFNRYGDRGNIGINMTRQAVENAQKLGIQTLCISIDTSQNYQQQIYGQNNIVIIDPKSIHELPIKVAKILSLILRRSGVKV